MKGYQDYLIMLSPPQNIISRIKQYKHSCAEIIGDYESRYSTAHITVRYLSRQKPHWIEPVLSRAAPDIENLPPVELEINGFGYFDHGEKKTIYARLTSTPSTRIWFKHLRKPLREPDREPHITVAKNISQTSFKALWPLFITLEWKEQLKIDRLTTLRRETIGYNRSYNTFREILFNGRPDRFNFDGPKSAPLNPPRKPFNGDQFSLF